MNSLDDLQTRLGVTFDQQGLLLTALTHRSYVNEHPNDAIDNERLEFLGDAVLAFTVGAMLYRKFPEMQEGNLTRLRAALVKMEPLAELAQRFELGTLLRLGKGEAKGGGAERSALLADAFEAVIGAVYLDRGIEVVSQLVEKIFYPLAQEIHLDEDTIDAKSRWQEFAQERFGKTPHYVTTKTEGPDHDRVFTVEVRIGLEVFGTGSGATKQKAEQEAARDALRKWHKS